MTINILVDEDFLNYTTPTMYIGTAFCDGKCCKEANIPISICQNDEWRSAQIINIPDDTIIQRYLMNDITKAICFAGLEPFQQYDEMFNFIKKLRTDYNCDDTIVIYTGFNKEEIESQVRILSQFKNIIIKYGRYVPDQKRHLDDVLGVYLASDNQYAEVIS